MNRRVIGWVLLGLAVAFCWIGLAQFIGPRYNLGRSTIIAITAPASLLGRKMPLGVVWFILLNSAFYALVGFAIEMFRRLHR